MAPLLAGFVLTPDALAAANTPAEAKKSMVVMNAATSIVAAKSPFVTLTSTTTPMLNGSLGAWATRNEVERAYTMVSEFGPGIKAGSASIWASGRRRRDGRLGPCSSRQSGVFRIGAARQGPKP